MNATSHDRIGADLSDRVLPISFDVSSQAAAYLQDPFLALLVAFFQGKGIGALKEEDRREQWYQDWIDYQSKHGIYASLLSPEKCSSRGHRLSMARLAHFVEAFAYFSPAHGYSLHVSLLGLFPILMSDNEPLKREAVAKLEDGGLFAFAVSEKSHGSDLFANEFIVRPVDGGWRADGAKYYIGNARDACLLSVLAKKSDPASAGTTKRTPFVFFALRPAAAGLRNVCKIRTLGVRTAFVGSFEVNDHPFPESDVISQGRSAWDAVRDTVNLGKFILGFGAIGICEHAFAEAAAHMSRRVLFEKPVTAMPHIRQALVLAFTRLTAMKCYAYRALDYLQVASASERRFLLWGAVQKARVSTEGVKVMSLLSECIGARGFESETAFETALRDIQMIPSLEGSTHINYGLAAQFMEPYFAAPERDAAIPAWVPHGVDTGENPYWLASQDRNARSVRFADFRKAYESLLGIANVGIFVKQLEAFRLFVTGLSASKRHAPERADSGLHIALGKCLAVIAQAQLTAESAQASGIAAPMVSVIFHSLIEDLSSQALLLSAFLPTESGQRAHLKEVVQVPETAASEIESVFECIFGRYRM